MPTAQDGSRNKGDPPAPESPVWLPSLAVPKGSPNSKASLFTLRKTKAIPLAGTTKRTDSELFSIKTLPALDPLQLPGAAAHKRLSAIPKLPSIEKSNRISSPPEKVAKLPVKVPSKRPLEGDNSDDPDAEDELSSFEEPMEEEPEHEEDGPPAPPLSDNGYDPDMLPGIVTGEDVIEFYGKYGQDSAVKFFYCNRAVGTVRFRPYDLVVVPRIKVAAEYFVLSATGVMRIRRGVQADFISLADWVREKTLFDLISSIGFFHNYLTGRCFKRWHKGMRQKNFNRIKKSIENSLFIAKPTFCPSLLEIFAAISEINGTSFVASNSNHLYTLQEYADLQVSTREHKAKPALEAVVEKIQKVLERVCREVQKQAKLYHESVRDASELEDTTGVELFQGRSSGRARPMITIKREKLQRASNFARVMREVTMLGPLIRLADYLFVEGVISRAIESAEEVLTLLTSPRAAADKQSKGVFLSTLSFAPDGITFTPDQGAVLEEINIMVEGIINIAQQAPRLVFMRVFSTYFEGKPSGLVPPSIIRATPKFVELRQKIVDTINEDFGAAREYVKLFEDYRKVYDFGRKWTFDEYSSKPRTMREIRRDMHKQREWRNELERMKISNVVGCLYIDSKTMRNDLLPITLSTLDKIKLLLLSMARDTCLEVLEDLRTRISQLQARPEQIDEFMSYMVMHTEQVENKRNVLQAASQVDDMYDMLMAYEQKVPTADQVKHDDLREAVTSFISELAVGKEFIADSKVNQVATLQSNIKNINEELVNILSTLHTGDYVNPPNPDVEPDSVVGDLENLLAHVKDLERACETYRSYQTLFDQELEDFTALEAVIKEANNKYQIWKSLADFMRKSSSWMQDSILAEDGSMLLDIQVVHAEVEEFTASAYKMAKFNKENQVVMKFQESIDEFKEILPLVEELANPAMKLRHWLNIFQVVGMDPPVDSEGNFRSFAVSDMLSEGYKTLDRFDEIQSVSTTASKEWSLEKALAKMKSDWEGIEFHIVDYKDTETFIVGGTDEIQMMLDDQIVKVQSMRASPFVKSLEKEASAWEALMLQLQDILDNWLSCQATWQYLEPIFGSPDIMKQMPEEGEKFQIVDQAWREVMESAHLHPLALTVGADKEMLVMLEENNKLLEEIQKSLAAYLEVKRIAFPRFFFLSNDEMLEILSETKDPSRVQPHLKKCFEGIDKLRFETNQDITGMISIEGELIPFKTKIKPSDAHGAVERWLVQVEAGMVESLQDTCQRGMETYPSSQREKWVLEWAGQVVLVVTAIFWTSDVTTAITSGEHGALALVAEKCTAQLGDIVNLVRGELSKMNRATLSALVVMDVHERDTVVALADEKLEGQPTHFSWLSQLRMYWEDMHNDPNKLSIPVRMMNAQVEYGYEYLGNSSRLVVTPLTDRCYRTLMGAIHLNLGGAPEGPAGTGKTETTKDLAKALARQCVVFNCSDTLDYLTMAKFFKGLASSGAWACFDEFNRIDLEVLSVVAQQVLEIQMAVKSKVQFFQFEGSSLPLRPTCNVFITMNPGYAGRSELPDNLKALFRTVAMMVPDYAMIAEIILYSNGYLAARECARKIVATYKLCSEQLSSQDHYDYGMRAVMAVLRAAGNLKRAYPAEGEAVLMLRSIIDVNLCKFLSHDVPLFHGIVTDLFPEVTQLEPDYGALTTALKSQCTKNNLQPTDYFIMKTIQLYEMIVVRHGLMTVGQPFSGKSSSLKMLSGALTELAEAGTVGPLFSKVQVRVVNPKSVTMGQLYGETDRATQEWKDGVLAVNFRQLAADHTEERKWLVLDGPVDAIWIENMNTVLDDNKKLCLPNSEIIQMSPTMSMIFEVGDLAAASPATVSRCGMVYLEPHQLGWIPLLTSWINTLPKALGPHARSSLQSLFLWMMPPLLRFVRKELSAREISPTEDASLARGAMRIIESSLDEFMPGPDEKSTPAGALMDELNKAQLVEGLFMFSLIWSVGCTCDAEGRRRFDDFFRTLSLGGTPDGYDQWVPQDHPNLTVEPIPNDAGTTVHDYLFSKTTRKWILWTSTIADAKIPDNAQFSDIIVPTKDSARYTFLLDLAIQHSQPILLVGPTGTGKSVYMTRHLSQGLTPREKWMPIFITFSARTTTNMTQEQVDGRLDKRRKGVYGPSLGRRAVVFVDDLNMPAKERYGTQPPIELLRQFMDYGGWYGRDNVFRALTDVQFVAAMGPPGGGRTSITNRYLRHFNILAVVQVSDDTLVNIFRTILSWHLTSKSFPQAIKLSCSSLISGTLDVYSASITKLLPTPTKSHYTFNLRDFARVVQGVMMMPAAVLPSEAISANRVYKRLWVHEVFRVFYDRLVDEKDRTWLVEQLRVTVQKYMGESFDQLMSSVAMSEGAPVTHEDMRRCFFGDYMDLDSEPHERRYNEITDVPKLITTMEDYLTDYNATSKRPMNLAMFLFAVEHVSRIIRLLKQPGGHGLLVGVGGSGRQSLIRLAAHICGMAVKQVEISKSYSKTEWREDLRAVLRAAGGEGKPMVFLFSDTQIKDESFVEDINNILNSGEVPNMYPMDEKMQVMEMVRPLASQQGLDSPLELWAFFVGQCRRYLHVMLAMSPIGDAFRERLRANPSLVNCCTIDWFHKWPADALEAVAMKFLREIELDGKTMNNLVGICQVFHEKVQEVSVDFKSDLNRTNYVTPTSYLELISCFRTLLDTRRSNNVKMKNRYIVGLEKLQNSSEQVTGMQAELQALQPQLVATVVEVEALMQKIAREKMEVVEPKAAIVKEEESRAQLSADAAKAIKDECEADLAEAMPILNDALSALDTIKDADINYIKKLPNAPAAIKLVMEAVCVILDQKPAKIKNDSGQMVPDYWKPSLALLNEREFITRLKTYDKDNIPPKIIQTIRNTYVANENFTPENARKASPAAEGMCKWVHAMSSYDKVAKVVAPKKAKLAEAEAAYEEVMVGLRAKQAELAELREKLAGMEADLKVNTRKKERLEAEVELCSVKLERAEKLIGGLGGEKVRWTETSESLARAYENLTGDMLIAAGIIAYCGAFTANYRQRLISIFIDVCGRKGVPHTLRYSLTSILGEPVKVRDWLIAGLPNDSFSIENAIIVASSRRWPLMIDPQGQANKWVKNLEKASNLQVIKLSEGGEYLRTLENAVQFGLPVLLENVGEELDPSLEPLLLKQTFKSGGLNFIRLGDATVEYSSDFRFYITTKLRNPHYLPEVSVKVTLLNFMITPEGLSDQMLGVVVATERPDLEEQKAQLVVQSAENSRKLKEIEDKILEVLSSSQGNILEDETAINVITEAKMLGNDISEKQKIAEKTEKEIDKARVGYKSCGDYTSILFFCISDLALIDPMYQYSLPWFVTLFVSSVHAAQRSEVLARRLDHILDHFTYSLYKNVCRSLFEKDKLLFAFLLCSRILESKGQVDREEWMFLITGGLGGGSKDPNPAPTWLSERGWRELCHLSELVAFSGLSDVHEAVANEPDAWKALYDSPMPHTVTLPGHFNSMDAFRKLLIVRAIRPDKVGPAIQDFVEAKLGKKYIEPPPFDLAACYADSTPTTPLIFVLSPGSDPTAALLQYAEEKKMSARLSPISLGQGQGPKAAAMIAEGRAKGTWIVLQNCHLAPSWMPTLDKICEELTPETTNPEFRLWMTSYPSPMFPVNILQNSVKMTNEPPKGIRANMRRSYLLEPIINEEFFEGSAQPAPFKKLLFGLVFFHAVVQERRKFGPLGWNIAYGFDDGDQRISVRQLRMFLDESARVPFAALHYVTGECNYGGRVTDDKDRILLNTLLARSYCPQIISEEAYQLSSSGLYYAPPTGSHASYLEYIDGLPATPLPEAFGLHENADIAKDQNDTAELFSSLLAMSGAAGDGGSSVVSEDRIAAVVVECLERLPAQFDVEAVSRRWPVRYEDSMNTVLAQEMSRFNRLVAVIRESLKSIHAAIQGLVVMGSDLDAAYRSISLNQVPAMWAQVSYPSLKPLGSYLLDLYRRLEMLSTWDEKGCPPTFWLSGFFFVQSFLTASLQNYARKRSVPIDMVGFDFQMMGMDPGEITQPPTEGVIVHGLFLEGAGWEQSARILAESQPKVLFVPAPCIWLVPVSTDKVLDSKMYNCPLYRTAERRGVLATTGHSTNFVMFIRLPTAVEPSHWILRGVALLTQLSD